MFLLKRTKIYRQNQLTIPNSFMISEGLEAGNTIDIYADNIDGNRALIIIPHTTNKKKIQTDCKDNTIQNNVKQ